MPRPERRAAKAEGPAGVLTLGHSNHAAPTFLQLLEGAGVERVADVRRFPGSRRLPHFEAEALAASLESRGIDYVHLEALGGRRRPLAESPNTGWKNATFRGYADHMRSPEFRRALERLESLARERTTAVMCAEALWWRCHRRLIADALLARGHRVEHLGSGGELNPHALTPFAVVEEGAVRYPAEQASLPV